VLHRLSFALGLGSGLAAWLWLLAG